MKYIKLLLVNFIIILNVKAAEIKQDSKEYGQHFLGDQIDIRNTLHEKGYFFAKNCPNPIYPNRTKPLVPKFKEELDYYSGK